MLQKHLKRWSLRLLKDVRASAWQQVKQQIRCTENSSFLVVSTGEIRSHPVGLKVSTLGIVNVGVWVFSTVLWVIISDQEVAFFLHHGLCSAVAPDVLMTLHRMNTRGSKSTNSSTGTGFYLKIMASAGRNSDLKAFYLDSSIIGECFLKRGWVCWQIPSNKLSFIVVTGSYVKAHKKRGSYSIPFIVVVLDPKYMCTE